MEVTESVKTSLSQAERETLFTELYEECFPSVARFVRKMGGSLEDAKDIFHDALVIYYEKTTEESFLVNSSPEAYLMGISKHLWTRKFRKDKGKVSLDSNEKAISVPEDYFPAFNTQRLLDFVERTGRKCLELLRAFYFEKLPVKDIASTLGYSSEHSASVQKYKCMEKVREEIKEKAVGLEDFVE